MSFPTQAIFYAAVPIALAGYALRQPKRVIVATGALVAYAAYALRQPESVTTIFCVWGLLAAIVLILRGWMIGIRVAATTIAYFAFIEGRIETRRILMSTAVLVWVIASAYFSTRLHRLGRSIGASVFGAISDLWLITMLTLLTLEGYIVTGLLLISAASWIPRAGKKKPWFALAYVLLGGWLIIAAKLDINLELRRWYLLGALAVGIGVSLFASAQEVQQGEDVHPQ